MQELAKQVKAASLKMAVLDSETKNKALSAIAAALVQRQEEIIQANQLDLKRSKEEKIAAPLLKRLKFDENKIMDAAEGLKSLMELPDPVGKTQLATELDTGLELYRVSCPIGVIGVIFESRPDALVQISALCLKSGNAVLLKGGSEARETNRILSEIILAASAGVGLDYPWLALLETREEVSAMLALDQEIDLIIPRGSNEFVRYIMENSRIPVLGHADGICHCYVDEKANLEMAVRVVTDSKTQYVAVCNATETLLVHQEIASEFLPLLQEALEEKKVFLKGCPRTRQIIEVEPAEETDWAAEYLDYILSIKIVDSLPEAIEHINRYGSGHTDCILTQDSAKAHYFMDYVDSGNVFWNCSTRFSDGFRYGFGAEVGISTNKIHARGPVGLEGLLIYKYKLIGAGHIVEDYSEGRRHFSHRPLEKDFE